MPTPDAPTPHDLTLENILYVADYSDDACGCEHRGDRWFMCTYHEGYDDGVERMVWIMERVHGPPMPDPSPDTPNVCPTAEVLVRAQFVDGEVWLVDDEGNEVGVMARSTFDRCVARPAAGSSSPDVAALAERLRAEEGHPDGGDITLGDLRAAADALEAQAARITELETVLAPFLRLMDPEEGGWRVLDVDFLEIDDSTPLTAGEADAIRALLTRHPRQETPE